MKIAIHPPIRTKERELKRRIQYWLLNGDSNLRRNVLEVFVELKMFRIEDVAELLWERGFDVSLRSVRSIVGQFPLRFRILKVVEVNHKKIYEFREEYAELVKEVLQASL